jgi:hypothetical protein
MAGIKVFLSYAHEDEALQRELGKHLGALKHEGVIEIWWDRQIPPGDDWNQEILKELEAADLILLLISPNFLDSSFCYKTGLMYQPPPKQDGIRSIMPPGRGFRISR